MQPSKAATKCSEPVRNSSNKKLAPRRMEYYEKVRRERLRLLIVTENEANAFRKKIEAETGQTKSPPKSADTKSRKVELKSEDKAAKATGSKANAAPANSSKPFRASEVIERIAPSRQVRPPSARVRKIVPQSDKQTEQRRASSASAVQRFSTSLTNRLLAEAALERKPDAPKETGENLSSLNDRIEKAFANFETWSGSKRNEDMDIQQRSAPASRSASKNPSPNTLLAPDLKSVEPRSRTDSVLKSKSESSSPSKRPPSFNLRIQEPVVHPLSLRSNAVLRVDSVANGSLPNLTSAPKVQLTAATESEAAAKTSTQTSPIPISVPSGGAKTSSKPVALVKPSPAVTGEANAASTPKSAANFTDRVDRILRNAVEIEREWNRFKLASSVHEARSERLSASLSRLVRSITAENEYADELPSWMISSAHSALLARAQPAADTATGFQVELGGAWAARRPKQTAESLTATEKTGQKDLNVNVRIDDVSEELREKREESPRHVAFDLETIRSIPYSIRKPLYNSLATRSKRTAAGSRPVNSILKKDATHRCDGENDENDLIFDLEPSILSSSAPH